MLPGRSMAGLGGLSEWWLEPGGSISLGKAKYLEGLEELYRFEDSIGRLGGTQAGKLSSRWQDVFPIPLEHEAIIADFHDLHSDRAEASCRYAATRISGSGP